jgi:ABC-type antimicrobial peptide transport system permease subunit
MRDLTEEHGRIEFHLSTASLLISTGVLFAVGLIAGLIPAFRAANLDPVKALQYE